MSENEIVIKNIYNPTELEISDVLAQVPNDISRESIIDTLIKTNGNVTEAILIILTNDNVVPKQDSPKRLYPKEEIKKWNDVFKSIDKYNIEHNVERVKNSQNITTNTVKEI